jgi:hypothetical protein
VCKIGSLIFRGKHRLWIFENRALEVFGSKVKEAAGDWRKLYKEEFHNLGICSPKNIRVMESKRMRRAAHKHVSGKAEKHMGFWWKNLIERAHLQNEGIHTIG